MFKPYTFAVPSLPKEQYEFVQRVCKSYEMSQRQVVITALLVMEEMGTVDTGRVTQVIESVKSAHPSRVPRG